MPSKKLLCLLIAGMTLNGCVELTSKDPQTPTPPVVEEPTPEPEPTPDPEPEPEPEEPTEPATDTPYAEGQNLASLYPISSEFSTAIAKIQRTINGNYLEKTFFFKPDETTPYTEDPAAYVPFFVHSDGTFTSNELVNQLLDTANYQVSWSDNETVFDMFHEQVDVSQMTIQDLLVNNGFSLDSTNVVDSSAVFSSGAEVYKETITSDSDVVMYPDTPEAYPGTKEPCEFPNGDRYAINLYNSCNFIISFVDGGVGYESVSDLTALIGPDLGSAPHILDIYRNSEQAIYKLVETAPGEGDIYRSELSTVNYSPFGSWSSEVLSNGINYIDIGPSGVYLSMYPPEYRKMLTETQMATDASSALFIGGGFVRSGFVAPTGSNVMTDILLFNDTAVQDVTNSIVWPQR